MRGEQYLAGTDMKEMITLQNKRQSGEQRPQWEGAVWEGFAEVQPGWLVQVENAASGGEKRRKNMLGRENSICK